MLSQTQWQTESTATATHPYSTDLCQCNIELVRLTGCLAPELQGQLHGSTICNVCRRFVELCRELKRRNRMTATRSIRAD